MFNYQAFLLFLSLAASLFFSTPVLALADDFCAPDVHIGDVWKYQVIDGFTGDVTADFSEQVVAMSESEITTSTAFNGKAPSLKYYTQEWNAIDEGGGKTYSPPLQRYVFPMRIGEVWKSVTTGRNKDSVWKGTLTAKAVSVEEIAVPAGRYSAVRIEYSYVTNDDSGIGRESFTTWYAPAVNRFIRIETTLTNNGRIRSMTKFELLSYKPASGLN